MMTLLSTLEIILGINGQLMTPVTKPTWQPLGELKLQQEEGPAKNKAWSEKYYSEYIACLTYDNLDISPENCQI